MKNWLSSKLDKEITWRAYWKFSLICAAIGMLIGIAELVWVFRDFLPELPKVKNPFKRHYTNCSEDEDLDFWN